MRATSRLRSFETSIKYVSPSLARAFQFRALSVLMLNGGDGLHPDLAAFLSSQPEIRDLCYAVHIEPFHTPAIRYRTSRHSALCTWTQTPSVRTPPPLISSANLLALPPQVIATRPMQGIPTFSEHGYRALEVLARTWRPFGTSRSSSWTCRLRMYYSRSSPRGSCTLRRYISPPSYVRAPSLSCPR
jgi:hypothetical protein